MHWLLQLRHQLKDMLFLFAFNLTLAVYEYAFGPYLKHLNSSDTFQMEWHDAVVYNSSWSNSFYPSPGAFSNFVIVKRSLHHNRANVHALWMVWYRGLQLFHELFTAHRPSYLIQRFWTLICQFKGLYSTALSSSLCMGWPTGAFWHCFAS